MKRSREEPIPRAKYLRERGWKKVPGTSRFGAAYWKDPRDPRISCIESLAVDEQRARDGSVTEDQASDAKTVLVKLDWPWDPQAPPEACDSAKLESEWDVRRRYGL